MVLKGISLNLTSISELWNSTIILENEKRKYAQCIICIAFWVFWNYRNKAIFDNSIMPSFNSLLFKILTLYNVWTGEKSELEHLLQSDRMIDCEDSREEEAT